MNTVHIRLLGAILLTTLALQGCAVGPRIYTSADPEADLGAFLTYDFADPLGTDRGSYSSLLSQHLKAAVSRELEARGYRRDADPDLLVNFFTETRERFQSTTTPAPGFGAWYPYRYGRYGLWGGYETRITQYTEGTLVIDLVDARTNRLVWEGIAVERVREEALREPRRAVERAVGEIFLEFPYRARSPGRVARENRISGR